MKNMMIIMALLSAGISASGQGTAGTATSGTVRYEEKMKIEIKLEGESAQYSDLLPKERTEKKILRFTTDASVYRSDEQPAPAETVEQEGAATMVVRVSQSDDIVYRDLKQNKRLEQRDFMSRMFLIESDAGAADWKLTGVQKTILGYPCQEATREEDGNKISAWFSASIPVSTGPGNYGNLPGLILAVDVNDGQRTIIATAFEAGPVDRSALVKPKEGKKVTAEQYKKIVDEKMKEMGAEGGGGGEQVIIRISR